MFIACKTLNDEMEIYNALLNNEMTGTSNPFGTAGIGICDMKGLEHPVSYDETDGVTLDDFCCSAMQQGLEYHVSSG